jgi:hypothetical protein
VLLEELDLDERVLAGGRRGGEERQEAREYRVSSHLSPEHQKVPIRR